MSITSNFQVDDSTALARQFAALTAGYIDNPPDTSADPAALVPLENVFRMLEMFRYDAFGDEQRGGVLAMDASESRYQVRARAKPWHTEIANALQGALVQAYGTAPKEAAIEELQGGLRELVKRHPLEQGIAARAKNFLTAFEAQLA